MKLGLNGLKGNSKELILMNPNYFCPLKSTKFLKKTSKFLFF